MSPNGSHDATYSLGGKKKNLNLIKVYRLKFTRNIEDRRTC